jgi:hypothetical protein
MKTKSALLCGFYLFTTITFWYKECQAELVEAGAILNTSFFYLFTRLRQAQSDITIIRRK